MKNHSINNNNNKKRIIKINAYINPCNMYSILFGLQFVSNTLNYGKNLSTLNVKRD